MNKNLIKIGKTLTCEVMSISGQRKIKYKNKWFSPDDFLQELAKDDKIQEIVELAKFGAATINKK